MRINPEPKACARKYLTAASVSNFVFLMVIRGMIDSKLSSIAAHITIRFLDEIVINVLRKRKDENRVEKGM